ncbi:trehalose-6-phosphate synthase [Natronoglomus mannanivorans]|uniref:Trehalose-6-phosphate synthase n=1 Tax=Natronoglomus mannanivorans TaxID=2979990 RepID=A0AAP3E1F5_9EURY|nr:trehalose-6-phosphate synthase [Halobacteria archaeon AArc-xg1-1]
MDDSVEAENRPLLVLTNRQPYSHRYTGDGIESTRSEGGLVTALDSVLQTTGGEWVAWGSAAADFDPSVVSADGELELPPDDPSYILERVELDRRQVDDFYRGYSNQVLWPLFHSHIDRVNVEPTFWEGYREVNARFTDEIVDRDTSQIWVHDYHFLLVPEMLTDRISGQSRIVSFVHIPWPPAEIFDICPHSEQLLEGVLASDHIGFHTESYRENFLRCVERQFPASTVDRESGEIGHRSSETGTSTFVQPVGIYPDEVAARADSPSASASWRALSNQHGLCETPIVVGVDRLDYTKGITKRLDALASLWERHPEYREAFVYVQKATKSRSDIDEYRDYQHEVREQVHRLNDRFATDDWQPIVYIDESLPYEDILGLYRHADVGVVSSTRDGMNLVALEFVAASRGTESALVVSEFAGAAETLAPDALTVNPFDIEALGNAIVEAVTMPAPEKANRTATLQESVAGVSAGRWLEENLDRLLE